MNKETQATEIIIRDCEAADMDAVTRIYAHHVERGLSSFEETAPDVQEMTGRHYAILQRNHPFMVAEINGRVLGFAYASTFRPRSAYNFTVENSVYVEPSATGQGIGSKLIEQLIDTCTELGFRQMIAIIGDTENHASIRLHERFGFKQVGLLNATGFKFGRWVDTVIMQRSLGDGNTTLA
ncbi:MAG: N-acetyltransferase [Rhodospirillaceae bacterium]|nr:N-acetyltransferase [Rhodospirillaceae bacterium]